MKTVLTAFLLLASATPALAQTTTATAFDIADTNHDGVISSGELQAMGAALNGKLKQEFTAADANHDGSLSEQEMRSTIGPEVNQQQALEGMKMFFAQADANHDGLVSSAENDAMISQVVGGLAAAQQERDKNHDGVISKAEWMAPPPVPTK